MPTPIPTQTVTAGQTFQLDLGGPQLVGALVLYNQSPLELNVSYGGGITIPPFVGDAVYLNNSNYSGTITITPTAISSANNAPSSIITGYTFAPGEPIHGTFPVSLGQLVNVGNGSLPVTSAQAVINDGNAAGTTVVEATQVGQSSSSLFADNSGDFFVKPLSAGTLLEAIYVTAGNATNKASGVFGDVNNPGLWLFHGTADQVPAAGVQVGTMVGGVAMSYIDSDAGLITSSGSGFLQIHPTAGYDAIELISKAGTAYTCFIGYGDNTYGAGVGLYAYDTAGAGFVFSAGTKSSITFGGNVTAGGGSVYTTAVAGKAAGDLYITPQQSGAAGNVILQSWDGTAAHSPLGIGGSAGVSAWFDSSGNLTTPSATVNGTLIVDPGSPDAIAVRQRFTGANGFLMGYGDGTDNPTGLYIWDQLNGGYICSGITDTANVMTNRNGTAQPNRIFTYTNTPSNPAVGDIWLAG